MLLLVLLLAVSSVSCVIINTNLQRTGIAGELNYVATVNVGYPLQQLKLEIRFDVDHIVLPKLQPLNSVEFVYSSLNASWGSELFFLNSQPVRLPVTLGYPLRCRQCDGVLGLGFSSPLFRIWNEATILASSLRLGGEDRHELFAEEEPDDDLMTLQCLWTKPEGGVCTVPALCENTGQSIQLRFVPDAPKALLPLALYRHYTTGRNLYRDYSDDWPSLRFWVTDTEQRQVLIELDDEDVHQRSADGRSVLLIGAQTFDNYTVVIGNSVWNDFILQKDRRRSLLQLRVHETRAHYSELTLVALVVLFFCLVRWKTADNKIETHSKLSERIVQLAFQLFADFLSIYSFSRPETRYALDDYQAIFYTTGILMGITLVFEWVATGYSFYWHPHTKQHRFEANLIRNASHEILIISGFWLALLETRTDSIRGLWVLFAQLFLCYSVSFYVVIFVVYLSLMMEFSRKGLLWSTISLFMAGTFLYQLYVTTFVFAFPFVDSKADVFRELSVQTTLLIVMTSILASLMVAYAYFEKGTQEHEQKLRDRSKK